MDLDACPYESEKNKNGELKPNHDRAKYIHVCALIKTYDYMCMYKRNETYHFDPIRWWLAYFVLCDYVQNTHDGALFISVVYVWPIYTGME